MSTHGNQRPGPGQSLLSELVATRLLPSLAQLCCIFAPNGERYLTWRARGTAPGFGALSLSHLSQRNWVCVPAPPLPPPLKALPQTPAQVKSLTGSTQHRSSCVSLAHSKVQLNTHTASSHAFCRPAALRQQPHPHEHELSRMRGGRGSGRHMHSSPAPLKLSSTPFGPTPPSPHSAAHTLPACLMGLRLLLPS